MKDLLLGLKENRVEEIFGAGTACIVSPVNRILYKNEWLEIPTMEARNPVFQRLQTDLVNIQFGMKKSPWMVEIPEIGSSKQFEVKQ